MSIPVTSAVAGERGAKGWAAIAVPNVDEAPT